MKTMLLTKLKALATASVIGCAVFAISVAGWRADETGAADPAAKVAKAADAPPKARVAGSERDVDKERIAELERERDNLFKEVAKLRKRLAQQNVQLAAERAGRVQAENRLALAPSVKREPGSPPYIPAIPAEREPGSPPNFPAEREPGPPYFPAKPEELNLSEQIPGSMPKFSYPIPNDDPVTPVPSVKSLVRVYPVSELAADENEGVALVKVLRATIEPKSWGNDAGVEYLPGRKVLVVRQTVRGHEDVMELLKQLQKSSLPPSSKSGSPQAPK